MKLNIQSTERLVKVVTSEGEVPARVFEGETDSGLKVTVLVNRVSCYKYHSEEEERALIAELKSHQAESEESIKTWNDRVTLNV